MVTEWLSACVKAGFAVPIERWVRLAELSAHSLACDRALLRDALGPRGMWFLSQNPRWARLTAGETSPAPLRSTGKPWPDDFAAILAVPDPWSRQHGRVSLAVIAGGNLGPDTRRAAVAVGQRLPLDSAEDVQAARASFTSGASGMPPSAVRALVEQSFLLLEQTVHTRGEIRDAFSAARWSPPEGSTSP